MTFRPADMLDLPGPAEVGRFDFLWSSCAFEHLGGIEEGLGFVEQAMRLLRPGGIAIHTTEFNVGSNDVTVETGGTVIYRRSDVETLAARLRRRGHRLRLGFGLGTALADYHVDIPPYTHDPHLKLHLMGHTTTSYGLAIVAGSGPVSRVRRGAQRVPISSR